MFRGILVQIMLACTFLLAVGERTAGGEQTAGVGRGSVRDVCLPDVPVEFQLELGTATSKQLDLREAERLFARGRVQELRGNKSAALSSYERSWRYYPCDTILRHIVAVAVDQDRFSEAGRYFDKLQTPESLGVLPLQQMAAQRVLAGEFKQAARAYRAALQALPPNSHYAIRVLLRNEMARIEYVVGDYDAARRSFEYVRRALSEPTKYDLTPQLVSALEREAKLARYLLLDTYLMLDRADDAAKSLEEIRERERETPERLRQWSALSGRIAAKKSQYEAARVALEFAFQEELEEDATDAYELYADVMTRLERGPEAIPYLEARYERRKGDAALGLAIAQLLYRAAQDAQSDDALDPEKKRLAWRRAEERFQALRGHEVRLKALVGLLRIAVEQDDPDKLIHVMFHATNQMESVDALPVMFALVLAEKKAKADTEGATAAEELQNAADAVEDAKAPELEAEPKPDVEKDAEKDADAALRDTELAPLARRTLDHAREHYPPEGADRSWKFYWSLSWLAGALGDADLREAYSRAAGVVLRDAEPGDGNAAEMQFLLESSRSRLLADRYEDAAASAREGLRFAKTDAEKAMFHYFLANVAGAQERFPETLREIDAAVRLQPEDLAYRSFQCHARFLSGEGVAAAEAYRQILDGHADDYDSDATRYALRDVRRSLSMVESMLGNMPAAEELLEQTLDEYPDDVGSKNDLAYLWAVQNKNLGRALAYARDALAEEPENYAYLDTLGWIYFQMGDAQLARETLEPIEKRQDDPDPVLFSHLADVYDALGDRALAIEWFQKSLDLFQTYQRDRKVFDARDLLHVETRLEQLKNQAQGG